MVRTEPFTTFGDLLKYLRARAQLSQRDLAIAVGYSEAQISRLESNKRVPDLAAVQAVFIPALLLEDEPELAAQLVELAGAHRKKPARIPDVPEKQSLDKRHNLPVELTSLVGRERDLAEVAHLLEMPTTRLLTLTGSGGCGKTRLALRSGANLAGNYPHGAWLVELAPLSDAMLIIQAVISALGLLVDPNRQPVDTLVAFLKERDILLILDNCEHLIDAVAQLVMTLLRACPDLQILATSREPLRLPGEVTYRVPSLAVPPAEWDGLPEAAPAAQLFLERANSAQPGYTLAKGEADALARICHRLGGIPLAIELAAARVSALPVSLIADRLEEGFAVLGSGGRGILPRHATLHAAVDWSYNLLSEPERVLLRRLPLFAGSWRLEQAEEVCTCGGLERDDVIDVLVSLVSKSLVVAEHLADGNIRYQLHEMVRQYARQRLVEAGEEETLQRCFLDYFIRLAEQVEPELKGPRQMEWLDRLGQEQDNLNEALSMAVAQRDALSAQRLAGALAFYWIYRDRGNEGRRWLETALALSDAADTDMLEANAKNHPEILSARAKALAGVLWQRYFIDQPAGDELAYECERIYMALNDARGVVYARLLMKQLDDLPYRMAQQRASLPGFLAQDDKWSTAIVYFQLWDLERMKGDFAAGKACLEECITYMRAAGDRVALARILIDRVWLEWDNGNIRAAYDSTAESLRVLNEVGLSSITPWAYYYLAYFRMAMGDFTGAYENLEKQGEYYQSVGAYWLFPLFQEALSRAYFLEGRLLDARKNIEEVLEDPNLNSTFLGSWDQKLWLGLVLFFQNHLDRSAEVLKESLATMERVGHHTFLNGPQRALGIVRLVQGDVPAARDLLCLALAEITRNHTLPDFPEMLDCLASLAIAEGHPDQAARLLGASDSLLARMEMVRYPVYTPEYERCRAASAAALGEAEFMRCYIDGKELAAGPSPIEAINLVLI